MLIDTYFARQPILDRRRRVRAYEVLYRPGPTVPTADFADGATATAQVLAGAFIDVDLPDLLAGLPGYVNLPRQLIVDRALLAFPPDKVGGEILEDVEPDDAVVEALTELKGLGYHIALDDFEVGTPRDLLIPYADVVKVDIQAMDRVTLDRAVEVLSREKVTLLAEKVETHEEFQRCKALGFELFQGFFFAKPELVAGRRLDGGRQQLLGLLAEIQDAEIPFDRIAQLVGSHATLSYQLLRVLNSASMGLNREVQSIREALVMLGTRRVVELVAVLVLAAFNHKSPELLTIGLTRARMCELIARDIGSGDPYAFFTVGLFSVLDGLTDRSMREIVGTLPLSDDVINALIDHGGDKGTVLEVALGYERAAWDELPQLQIEARSVSMAYLEAIEWSGAMLQTTSGLAA